MAHVFIQNGGFLDRYWVKQVQVVVEVIECKFFGVEFTQAGVLAEQALALASGFFDQVVEQVFVAGESRRCLRAGRHARQLSNARRAWSSQGPAAALFPLRFARQASHPRRRASRAASQRGTR